MNELANQVAVVTGAGRGIGQAIALKLAAAGADIASVDLKAEFCDETGQKVQALGRKAATAKSSDVCRCRTVITLSDTLVCYFAGSCGGRGRRPSCAIW